IKKSVNSDNIAFAIGINGIIDEVAINHAFKLLIKKNSAFRSNFIIKENAQQQIFREEDNIRIIEFVDKSDACIINDIDYLAYTQKAFDIENDSLLRITIIKSNHLEYTLLPTAH